MQIGGVCFGVVAGEPKVPLRRPKKVGQPGFEPGTFRLSVERSNQIKLQDLALQISVAKVPNCSCPRLSILELIIFICYVEADFFIKCVHGMEFQLQIENRGYFAISIMLSNKFFFWIRLPDTSSDKISCKNWFISDFRGAFACLK